MDPQPQLIETEVPDRPAGAVLVLHGGASRGAEAVVSSRQLSVRRMVPIARAIASRGEGRLAVFRLLNTTRGWNPARSPVDDARWALDEIAERLGERRPACLVGHSLGGRAALLAADAPEVRSAVALAPWVYPDDIPDGLEGRRILFLHGSKDRVASPARSAALAEGLRASADVDYVVVEGSGHAMLRHHRSFSGPAADFAAETLLDTTHRAVAATGGSESFR